MTLGATLLVAPPSRADGAPVSEATSAQRKSAEKKLAAGKKLFKAGKLEQAIVAFDQAHEIVADPEARLLKARARQNLGELLKAHAEYTAAVAEAEAAVRHDQKYRETLQAARKELQELEGVLARLTIKLRYAPEGTRVTIDGEPLGDRKLGEPILIAPGQVKVVAQTADGREASRQVALTAGQDAKVELAFVRDDAEDSRPVIEDSSESQQPRDATEPAKQGGGTRTAAFIAGGVGVAGFAAFGVLGAMSNSKYSKLEDACPNARCSPDQQDNIDDGKLYQTLANVGLAVGVAGLGTSAGLFIFGGSGQPDKEQEAARLELSVGLRSIELRGRFE